MGDEGIVVRKKEILNERNWVEGKVVSGVDYGMKPLGGKICVRTVW